MNDAPHVPNKDTTEPLNDEVIRLRQRVAELEAQLQAVEDRQHPAAADLSADNQPPAKMNLEQLIAKRTSELQESENWLASIFDTVSAGICVTDKNATFVRVNPAYCRIYGYEPEELLGHPFTLVVPPENQTNALKLHENFLRGDLELPAEWQVRRKDGRLITVDVVAGLLEQRDGERFKITVVIDITEKKQLQEAIQQSKTLLQTVVDTIPSLIFVKDPDGRFILTNRRFNNFFEVKDGSLIGKKSYEILPAAEADRLMAAEKQILEAGQIVETEELLPHQDATRIYNTTFFPMYSQTGEAFALGIIAQDVTERKQVEAELAEYRTELEKRVNDRTARLQLIAELSGKLNALLDLDKLLLELVNQIRDSFGYYHVHVYLIDSETGDLVMTEGSGEVGRMLKAQNHRLVPNQGIVGKVASTNQYFLSNNVDEVPHFFRNPLLPETNSELAVPIDLAGEVIGVLDIQSEEYNRFTENDISLMQSIADQTGVAIYNARLLEERQATIRQLQEVDRLKSEFLTTMSHEIRTPLNAILGFAELLQAGLSGALPAQAQEDVQLIYNSGQHLLALLNDILDLSKIEAGMIEIVPEPLAVNQVIEEVIAASEALKQNKPIELVVDLPSQLPLVYADKTRLKQILLNLLENALEFTKEGQVTISATVMDHPLETTSQHQWLRLAIRDTGIGIPQEKLRVIFEQFEQVDMSKTREHGGSGLGLTICQQLVKLHGGQIGVNSQEGVGSEFYFTLPLADGDHLLDD